MRHYRCASIVTAALLLLCTARTAAAQAGQTPAGPAPKGGEGGGDQQIEKKLDSLQKEIEALGTKIDRLEKSMPAQPGPGASPSVGPQGPGAPPAGTAAPAKEVVRSLWKNIVKGITQDQVERILGPPELTMQVDTKTVWYYYYQNIGGGSVVFEADGKVIDWQKPPFGWWKLW